MARPRPRPRHFMQDQDHVDKTETKTKTSIYVLEKPRDQDHGLEDYNTAHWVIIKSFNC